MKTIIFIAWILCLSQNLIAQKHDLEFLIVCESSNFGKVKYSTTDLEDDRLKNEYEFTVHIETSNYNLLDSILSYLRTAEKLNIYSDSLTELGNSLGSLSNLKNLFLDCPKLETLPKNIGEFDSLKVLTVYESKITRLPPSFSNLKNLIALEIIESNLIEFPQEIIKLKNGLTRFEINMCEISSLPLNFNSIKFKPEEDVTYFKQKGFIGLGNFNQLKKLPPNIRDLNFRLSIDNGRALKDISSINSSNKEFELGLDFVNVWQFMRVLRSIKNANNLSLSLYVENTHVFLPSLIRLKGLEKLGLKTLHKKINPRKLKRLKRRMPDTKIFINKELEMIELN